jgi:hypothetical protein
MKVELVPEDCLLEFTRQLLDGEEKPVLKYARYFDKFPQKINFSEEFAASWQDLLAPTVHKFIADSFSLHQFAFIENDQVRKYSCADQEFWQTIELGFSQRSALRLYEAMMAKHFNEPPLYILATPADALFIAIATSQFTEYSFPLLAKNSANWVITALFIAWQPVNAEGVAWNSCFTNPASVDFPVRSFLLERATTYLSCVNHLIRKAADKSGVIGSDFFSLVRKSSGESVPMKFISSQRIDNVAMQARSLIKNINSAMDYWTGEGSLALDDDRYLRGVLHSSGLQNEMNEFDAVLNEYQNIRDLEANIDESVIFN